MSEVSAIIARLVELKQQQERLESEAKTLWRAFYSIADIVAGEGEAYRFLDEETELVIARIIRKSETLDEGKLEAALTHQQWLAVTEPARILDQAKLDVALRHDRVPQEAVEGAMERKSIASKFGPRKASKEELEELAERRAEEGR